MSTSSNMEIEKIIESQLKELPDYFILAIISAPEKYHAVNIAIANYLINKKRMSGVYITMNKPYKALVNALEKDSVDTKKLFFIDAISGVVGGEKLEADNCTTLAGPTSLTDLGIVISKVCCSENPKFMIMDSLSTMLVYNNANATVKFVHYLTTQLRTCGWPGIIFSLEEDMEKHILNSVTQFCDKVIKV